MDCVSKVTGFSCDIIFSVLLFSGSGLVGFLSFWLQEFRVRTVRRIWTNLDFNFLVINGLQLGEVADFGAQNCQYTTKVDVR